jgi:hypothetical protein
MNEVFQMFAQYKPHRFTHEIFHHMFSIKRTQRKQNRVFLRQYEKRYMKKQKTIGHYYPFVFCF